MMSNCSQGWFLIRILALKRINWGYQPNARSNLKMRIRVRMSSISFSVDISTFVFLSVRAFLIDRFPLPFSLFVIIIWTVKACLQWSPFWMQSPLIFLFWKQKKAAGIIFRGMVWCCPWWKSLHTPTDIMIESLFAESVCYHRVINRNPRSPKWGKDKKGKSQIFLESLLAASYIATLATEFFCRVEHSSLLFSRRRRVQPSS